MNGPRIGELFAGYGGLGMGVKAAIGGEVAWVSDIDKGACKILAHRFPGVPNIGDITTVDWSAVEPVDVLTGGFPCQDVSSAGNRAGIRPGTRSGLWGVMAYAIDQLRPELVVIENVRGLLSAEAHSDVEPCPWCVGDDPDSVMRALGAVLGDLAELGYDAVWHGLLAADVGAPHGRFRVFIVAHPQHAQLERVRPLSGLRGGPDARAALRVPLGTGAPLLPTPAVNDMGEGKTVEAWDAWTDAMKTKHGNGNGHGASLAIGAQRLLPTPKASNNENRTSPGFRPGVGRQLVEDGLTNPAETGWGQYADAIARWEALTRPAPPPTETGPKGNPRLSARFSEWLMGLPDGWITDVPGITRNEALKAAGNGVCPQQAEAAVRFLLGVMEAAA